MMRKISVLLCLMATLFATAANAQRTETLIKNWRFTKGDPKDAEQVNYNDKKWEQVTIPHDWAISGPFNKEIDKQVVAIEQNGEKEATEKTGRSGSLPWIGTGWYRTTISVPQDAERVLLSFDGAMAEPEVYVNGKKTGEWKYGYTPFVIDITKEISEFQNVSGGFKQVPVAVRLQNVEESSRWYPGAGLIRPVKLIVTKKTALKEWSINAETLMLGPDGKSATEEFTATVANAQGKTLRVEFNLCTDSRKSTRVNALIDKDGVARVIYDVNDVKFWTPESPNLYHLIVSLYEFNDGKPVLLDRMTKNIGFRTVKVSSDGGFQLNGISRKIKGVCLHHDLGMLGAAINKSALIRQIKLLKTMGCDAIRTSHNIPSQMQMDICDSLGMMVMAESFDMWIYPKCKNGYAKFFKDWSDRDIEHLVCANRIHPSIIMWSVGNEIPEQWSPEGAKILRHLQDVVHKYDTSRPITNGMDKIEAALKSGFAQVADCPGMNYRTQLYEKAYAGLGQGYVLGSETASTVSSRGVYKFPVVRADGKAYPDGQCSSYDMEACWWSNTPEDDWLLQDDRKWVIGEFVWTGFDYLGEPTPYDEYWPSRSSYFGIFDLAGLPKDRYYLYRSRWNTKEPTLHLLPHWNWKGREGEVTPVYCYSSWPTAELFVNGKSLGKITKNNFTRDSISTRTTDVNSPLYDRYRLRWNDVKYEPGEIKVVAYDANGNAVAEQTVKTAGAPAALTITNEFGGRPQTTFKRKNGEDMLFFTVNMMDKDGNLCPDADNQINVKVTGAATFKGICNGDATSLEVFTKPTMKLFHGQLVVGVKARSSSAGFDKDSDSKKDVPGEATLTVSTKGLKPVTIKIN